MDYRTIEIFLDLVQTRNITKTAQRLYLSQSTVSKRLQALEDELRCQLIQRTKGKRELILTRQGETYIAIAERWKNLFEETEVMKSAALSTIIVGVSESAYFGFIAPFLRTFLDEHQDVRIVTDVYNSDQIYEMLDHHLLDYGIVAYESHRPGIQCRCISRQRLCIVRYAEKPQDDLFIDPKDLDPTKEIRFNGGNFRGMNHWRKEYFGTNSQSRLEINSIQGVVPFLENSDYWVICTPSMAEAIGANVSLQVYQLAESSEIWEVYFLKKEYREQNLTAMARSFEEELMDYVCQFNKQID